MHTIEETVRRWHLITTSKMKMLIVSLCIYSNVAFGFFRSIDFVIKNKSYLFLSGMKCLYIVFPLTLSLSSLKSPLHRSYRF